jgi:hypothetical protein
MRGRDGLELFFEHVTAIVRMGERSFSLCAMCAILASCGKAQSVKIDFDRNFEFAKVQRYEWRPHRIFDKHPELRERYSTAIQLGMNATNQQLMKKGTSLSAVRLTFS